MPQTSPGDRVAFGLSVLFGLLTLGVAYLVLNAVSSRFERIVVALLVLIYASTRIDRNENVRRWSEADERDFFDRHDRTLDAEATSEERELRIRELKLRTKMVETSYRAMVQSHIVSVSLALVWLLAFLHLIVAVVFTP